MKLTCIYQMPSAVSGVKVPHQGDNPLASIDTLTDILLPSYIYEVLLRKTCETSLSVIMMVALLYH